MKYGIVRSSELGDNWSAEHHLTSDERWAAEAEAGTNPAKLPQHLGRPVPWVTKWTGETSTDPFTFAFTSDGQPAVAYPDGIEFRDEHGYLWRREGSVRRGEPQYRQVNAHRQRQCMRTPRCQVCGRKLPDGPIRWLMSKNALSVSPQGVVTTINPPTCDGCVPLARQLCPHLSKTGSDLLLVKRWRVYGVCGELIVLDGLEVVNRIKDVTLEYGRSYKGAGPQNLVVRQQVAALDDYEVLESADTIG